MSSYSNEFDPVVLVGDGRLTSSGEGYQKNNRIFNMDVTENEFDTARNARPLFILPIAIWRKEEDMSKEEKKNVSNWSQMGGYLKTLSYKDAWAEAWPTASDEFKKWVKGLPHFNAELFETITGLKWEDDSLIGTIAEVKIGGKTYKAKIID